MLQPGGRLVLVAEVYKIGYHMAEYNTPAGTVGLLENRGFRQVRLLERKACICATGEK